MITFRRINRFGRTGIGNKLFQYTGSKLYAEINGYKSSFPAWIGTEVFSGVKSYTVSELLLSKLLPTCHLADQPSYNRWEAVKFILSLPKRLPETKTIQELYAHPRDNLNIYGYLQDPFSIDLLLKNKKRVLEWFKLKPEIQEKFSSLVKPVGPWVAVHLRRGDFEDRLVIPTSTIVKKLKEIQGGRKVYVASNDPSVAKEFEGYNRLSVDLRSLGLPAYMNDFLMIMNAGAVIGCGSTFSWWAAYLGNKNQYYSAPLTNFWQKDERETMIKWEI